MVARSIEMEDITISKNGWRVTLSYQGEGYAGLYIGDRDSKCKDSPDDPLVRFTVYERIGVKYVPVKHGSQLTFLRPTDSQEFLTEAAQMILEEVLKYDGGIPALEFYQYLGKIHLYNKAPRLLPAYGSPTDLDD